MESKSISLAISVLIHGIAFLALMGAPSIKLPRPAESEYKQAIAGKEEKIVWYKFKELPKVSPPRAKAEKRPLRAATKSTQSLVSAPKDAPERPRMVWTPVPEIHQSLPLESPNLLAIKLPDPPPPALKPFVAPAPPPKPELTKVDIAPAPDLNLQPVTPVAELRKPALPPKPYVAPPVAPKPAAAQPRLTPDAPQIQTHLAHGADLPSMRLPPKVYVAPPGPARPAIERTARLADAAPALASTTTGTGLARNALPPIDLPANSRALNVAVVGLNPADKAAPLPTASSPASFSSGPQVRPDGAKSEGGSNGLSVPDLFVRGPREAKPDLVAQAYAAPTSRETLRAAMRSGEPVMTVHGDPPPAPHPGDGMKVSSAPDPRFNGRDTYMMAVQMANLTSYSGSWLMWYADRTAREAGLAPIAAPVPHRKVDPKYIATAVEEHIEGRVQLACVIDKEGKVTTVEIVRGADPRLNQSAREALSKWEFYPATRDGIPVEVDVLVEIPFRLAPRLPGR